MLMFEQSIFRHTSTFKQCLHFRTITIQYLTIHSTYRECLLLIFYCWFLLSRCLLILKTSHMTIHTGLLIAVTDILLLKSRWKLACIIEFVIGIFLRSVFTPTLNYVFCKAIDFKSSIIHHTIRIHQDVLLLPIIEFPIEEWYPVIVYYTQNIATYDSFNLILLAIFKHAKRYDRFGWFWIHYIC